MYDFLFFWITVAAIIVAKSSIVIAYLLYQLVKKSGNSDDDPTGELKQEIFDNLNKIIADVKSTV